jgi:hypothetical protein
MKKLFLFSVIVSTGLLIASCSQQQQVVDARDVRVGNFTVTNTINSILAHSPTAQFVDKECKTYYILSTNSTAAITKIGDADSILYSDANFTLRGKLSGTTVTFKSYKMGAQSSSSLWCVTTSSNGTITPTVTTTGTFDSTGKLTLTHVVSGTVVNQCYTGTLSGSITTTAVKQ